MIGATGRRVADNIARVRKQQRLTYTALSAKLENRGREIPVLGLRRIERYQRRVDVDDLVYLAEALGVPVDRLLWVDGLSVEVRVVERGAAA